MEIKELPSKIELTIQEEDRLKAGPFSDNEGCLIHTVLTRMGYNHSRKIKVYPNYVDIGVHTYLPEPCDAMLASSLGHLGGTRYNPGGPYYSPDVVGKTITLIQWD